MQVFEIDGKTFAVDVTELKRLFAVEQTQNSQYTMDGMLYREPIGTYCHYEMKLRPRPGNQQDMDALWEIISSPLESHDCTFPYNQTMLRQKMYVTGGAQKLLLKSEKGAVWGELTVQFTALQPRVVV